MAPPLDPPSLDPPSLDPPPLDPPPPDPTFRETEGPEPDSPPAAAGARPDGGEALGDLPEDAPAVILVRPQEEGNVGAAARAMANMGLGRLVLVEPAPDLGPTARAFAVKAGHILDGAVRVASLEEAIAPYARVVGTTSSRSRTLAAPLLTPRQLAAEMVAEVGSGAAPHSPALPATTLVFGPEASGLTNEELSLCSRLVVVPCAAAQPTLNLAQAVLIVAYELYMARIGLLDTAPAALPAPSGRGEVGDPRPQADRASAADLDGLFAQMLPLLRRVGFARDDTFPGVLRDLRALAARAEPREREIAILRGICRRTARTLEFLKGENPGSVRPDR